MRFRFVALLVLASLTMIFVISCDNDGPSEPEIQTVQLSGTAYSYICYPPDSADMSDRSYRHMVMTGRRADVRFFQNGQELLAVETDDSSAYAVNVQVGTITIAVEMDHTVPEIIANIDLTADTVIDIWSRLRFASGDTVVVIFSHLGQPLPEELELDSLSALNQEIGGMLNLSSPSYSTVNNTHVYRIPLAYGYRPWQFAQAVAPRYVGSLSIMWAQPIYRGELCPEPFLFDWDWWYDSLGNGFYEPPEPIIDTIP